MLLPLHTPLPLLLCLLLPDHPNLFLYPVRAIAPAQGVVVRRNPLQAPVFLCQPVKGGVQRTIPLLEPVIAIVQPIEAVYKVKILVVKRTQDANDLLVERLGFLFAV